jgi:predicted site-specific integrase-resolvase
MQGESITLVVSYKDRVARFGYDLIESIITRAKGKIVVLNQINTSPEEELNRDLVAIITVFSARLHGIRSYKDSNKKHLLEANKRTEGETSAVDGSVPLGIQQNY